MPTTCPSCGAPIPEDALASGVCPGCLLRLGLGQEGRESGPADATPLVPGGPEVSPPLTEAYDGLLQLAPNKIGPYRILRRIGEGGMGEVYEAEQREPIERKVALKLLKWGMDSKQVLARFELERHALALMDHPAIARVYDAGSTEQGRPYFAMELVRGIPITDYCDTHRLTIRERLGLFIHICEGVQHAHQKGIIHRDIKPSNILVQIQQDEPVPKIIDFGLAKATAQRLTERTVYTEYGRLIGTPEYMSPEQAEMTGLDIDTRADIYSLGVVLYELLVGALPFDAQELREAGLPGIQRRIREEEPPKPSRRWSQLGEAGEVAAVKRRSDRRTLAKRLRGDLDWIVMKALDKDRTRRYAAAEGLALDLQRHLQHEPVRASPPSTVYRIRKFVLRHKVGVAAAALVTAAVLLGLVGTLVGLVRATAAEARAVREAETAARVSEFLVDLFKVSDPMGAGGESITAREILDLGAGRVDRELSGQPEVQATLKEAIGNVYRNLGLYDRAEPLLREALESRGDISGEENLAVAQSLHNMASVLLDKGEYAAARPLFERSLAVRTRLLRQDHPEVAESLHNLGRLHYEIGEYSQAEQLYRQAIEAERQNDPQGGVELGEQLGNLAELLAQMGDYEEAGPLYHEALTIRRRTFGNRHPLVGESLNDLGVFLGITGDFEGAEPLLREALEIQRQTLGDLHPSVATALNNLGRLLKEKGDYAGAEGLYVEALDIRRSRLGLEHPRVALQLHNLGWVQYDLGKLQDAELSFREAVAIRRKVFGPEHSENGVSLQGLGVVLTRRGRAAEAERVLRESVRILAAGLPPGHWRTAEARAHLGDCLAIQGRYSEAEELLVAGYRTLRETRGSDNRRTQYSLGRLIALYEAWGKPEAAARYRAEQRSS